MPLVSVFSSSEPLGTGVEHIGAQWSPLSYSAHCFTLQRHWQPPSGTFPTSNHVLLVWARWVQT